MGIPIAGAPHHPHGGTPAIGLPARAPPLQYFIDRFFSLRFETPRVVLWVQSGSQFIRQWFFYIIPDCLCLL